ncbi:MAG: hypothetical protein ABJK64_14985 [Paraglaciecola sp.]|uniref:hypothetical protein n=1 Tax=Paraglaciecola sp. TaxID=1920173 RepID=UPI003299DACA
MLVTMDNMEIDFSTYSLKELREAWISIDDYVYPDRAIEIYLLLKKVESETEDVHFLGNAPNWVVTLLRIFFRPPKLYETTFSDVLLEESNAEMKEQRVKELILKMEDNGN